MIPASSQVRWPGDYNVSNNANHHLIEKPNLNNNFISKKKSKKFVLISFIFQCIALGIIGLVFTLSLFPFLGTIYQTKNYLKYIVKIIWTLCTLTGLSMLCIYGSEYNFTLKIYIILGLLSLSIIFSIVHMILINSNSEKEKIVINHLEKKEYFDDQYSAKPNDQYYAQQNQYSAKQKQNPYYAKQNANQNSLLSEINQKIEETTNIMGKNIKKQLNNNENLDYLQGKADKLAENAKNFKVSTNEIMKKFSGKIGISFVFFILELICSITAIILTAWLLFF